MNFEELRERQIDELEIKLRNNQHVRIWNVIPYRFELLKRLVDDERATEYLRECIEFANESN